MYGSQHVLGAVDYISPFIAVLTFISGVSLFTLTVVKFIYSKNETTKLAHSFASFRGKAITQNA